MQPEYRSTAQQTWDAIADSFDTTRQKPWKYCLDFICSLKKTDLVVDIGCGNGRHLLPCAAYCSHVVGVDISPKLLRIIQKKLQSTTLSNVSLVHADAVQMPFADNQLDAILFIASLHNIQGKQNRNTALKEIARVLKPNGVALISVWSRWQERYYKYFLKQLIVDPGGFGDINVYWRQHNLNIPRFYHLYSKGEFLRELKGAGFRISNVRPLKIHAKRFPDNYFAVVQKR
ncbi:MAG TPA: class I SAM-dependent methyltransferase [Thermoplasmata archaeon]|jgi:tRNA (uracil-5-)-methyltransferase TRM9|nr:MAG TPA: class I SAM-dependent methyltransferase [Thermoplasmata archaeon]